MYNVIVEKHKNYAYTIAYNILHNAEDAEEVAHDAFIKAYKNLDRFNKEAKFSTWLYRIVFNTAISAKRKKKMTTESIDEHYNIFKPETSVLEQEDQQKYLHIALSQLIAADKTALTLFYLKEHSIEEIAEITEQEVSTVKVRLFRARKRLAIELTKILNQEALTL